MIDHVIKNKDAENALWMYRFMLLTREFEYALLKIFKQRGLPEVLHLCEGEEAIGVGACCAMRKDDVIVPSLRSRAILLSRGVSPKILAAGVFGKETGSSRGKYTAHHMGDLDKGVFSASLCIGSQIPLAVGAAMHFKQNKTDQASLVTFGDGATNRGDFHESLNLAAVFKLPVIFICENNSYAIDTLASEAVAVDDISVRAKSYNIPGVKIDGNDVLQVFNTVSKYIELARKGDGPALIECKTYRMRPHTEYLVEDRPKEEISYWANKCPIKHQRKFLIDNQILDEIKDDQLLNEIKKEVSLAMEFGMESSYPDVDEIYNDVYADF